ncbi:hypothetical protein C8A00DRAFT_29146 [Chaetomidium leptoderma]|uniref:Uncharacterized protein n=1 Tax=Chaetomidium leptoderma TaxID=669021 RepID=A0AAN6VU97_9PEZI|nr:hypothetical protein C8A00DRAFT_29146 [Chaetomidium leptoderma]
MESPRSPKRRRILSSINPPDSNAEDDAPRRYTRDRTMTPDASAPRGDDAPSQEGDTHKQPEPQDGDTAAPRTTKFRFKSKSCRSSRRREGEDEEGRHRRRHRHRSRSRSRSRSRDRDRDKDRDSDKRDGNRERDDSQERRRRRRRHQQRKERDPDKDHHRRRHRHHHRSRSPAPPPSNPKEDPFQQQEENPPLSPTTAFRESLFDAMADDEGAAYWESVYGQPIHIYNNPHGTTASASSPLERMTDDEYAAYVRQKMWEKTHAGLLEARARRDKERGERERERERERGEKERVAREMERCLRRGEERRRRKGWRAGWEGYLARWAEWDGVDHRGIPWPGVVSDEEDGEGVVVVQGEAVRAFFVNGIGLDEVGEKAFAARLKEERVRWHPDKMQQRLGGKVDEKVMRDVTAIFQVVDTLWNDTRKHGG